jgi:hypothetical protein
MNYENGWARRTEMQNDRVESAEGANGKWVRGKGEVWDDKVGGVINSLIESGEFQPMSLGEVCEIEIGGRRAETVETVAAGCGLAGGSGVKPRC